MEIANMKTHFVLFVFSRFGSAGCVFYAEEDWRGKRAWENCKRELEAKGAVLDWNNLHSATCAGRPEFFQGAQRWRNGLSEESESNSYRNE